MQLPTEEFDRMTNNDWAKQVAPIQGVGGATAPGKVFVGKSSLSHSISDPLVYL